MLFRCMNINVCNLYNSGPGYWVPFPEYMHHNSHCVQELTILIDEWENFNENILICTDGKVLNLIHVK